MSRRLLLSFVLVLLAVACAYAPRLDQAFLWDDFVQIASNPAVTKGVPVVRDFTDRDTTSTRRDYNTRIWRPLRTLGWRGLWRISELAPERRTTFFHGANLVLYLVGGLLVLALCRRFVTDELALFFGAGLWLLLPVHAEDVMYASAFGDLLSFDCQLAGLLLAMRALDRDELVSGALSLVVFAIGLLVKEMAITTVVLLPAYVLSERRALLWKRKTIALVGLHGLLGLAYLVARTKLLGRVGQDDVHASGTLAAFADAPWLVAAYVRLAFVPLGHAPDYGIYGPTRTEDLVAALVVVPCLVLACLRAWRGARFGVWVYLVALLPVMHFVPLWTLLADRFLLVPSVGLALVIAALVSYLPSAARRPAMLVVGAYAVVCLLATALEAKRFANDETLFGLGVAEVPESALSRHNFGLSLLKRGDAQHALDQLLKAEALGRRDPRLYAHIAGAFEGIGNYTEAERSIGRALELDPAYGGAYVQRALLEKRRGDLAAADRDLDRAEQNDADRRQLRRERAAMEVSHGRVKEAYAMYVALATEVATDPVLWQHAAECAAHEGMDTERRMAATKCTALAPDRRECVALSR